MSKSNAKKNNTPPGKTVAASGERSASANSPCSPISQETGTDPHQLALALKQAQETLLQSEERYRELVETTRQRAKESDDYARRIIDSSLDMIISVDLNRKIKQFNRTAEDTFGYCAAEIIGKPVDVLYADPQESLRVHQITLMNGQFIQEVLNRRKNGELFTSFLSASILETSGGKVIGYTGISRDISEQKRNEASMDETKQRYRAFVQQSSEAIWRVELKKPISIQLPAEEQIKNLLQDGFIAECNDEMAKMYGYSRADEFVGTPVNQFVPTDDPHLREFVRHGYRVRDAESREQDRHGHTKYFRNNFVGIVENGFLVRLWGTQTDITERKSVEQRLVSNNRRLRLIAEMTSAVVGSTPLLDQARLLVAKVREAFEVDACVIRILEGEKLSLLASTGIPQEVLPVQLQANEGVASEILNLRKPVYVPDARVHQDAKLIYDRCVYKFISYAGAPLVREDHVVGILAIYSEKELRHFSEADLEHLQIVANHISVSIVNDRLYKEQQEQKNQLEKEITERQRAEDRIARSLSLLGATLESTADGILVVNESGKIVSYNQKFLEMWRMPKELIEQGDDGKALSQALEQLKYPDTFLERVKTLYEHPSQESHDLIEFKDGRIFERYSQAQMIGGKPVGRVWSFQDITERKRAEEALHKSELQLRLVWENSLDGMRLVDGNGVVRLVNDAYCKLIGKTRDELEGRPLTACYAGESEEILQRHQERFRSHNIPSHSEKEYTLWNGRRLFLELTNTLIEFESGQDQMVLTLFRDITERKRAELRNSVFTTLGQRLSAARTEKEVAEAVLQASDDLLSWQAAYLVRYFPDTNLKRPVIYFDTLDRQRAEIPVAEIDSALSPRLQKVIQDGAQIILRNQGDEAVGFTPFGDKGRPSASILAVPIRHKDAVIGVMSIQSYAFYAYTNSDLQSLQTLADFSGSTLERITAEQTLTEERNLLRTLIDNLPDYIYVKDKKSRNLLDNVAHRRLHGIKDTENLIGKTVADYFPRELADQYLKDDQLVLQSGQPLIDREEPIFSVDGVQRWLLTTKVPFRDERGHIAGIVGISRDITIHKQAEVRGRAFSTLAQRLSAVTTMEDAGRVIVEIADELLGWDSCYLHLCSPDRNTIQCILSIDIANGERKKFHSDIRKPSAQMIKAMQEGGQLVLREEPILTSSDFAPFGDATRPSASIVIVPVRNNQNVIGVLSIQSYKKNTYDHKSLESLQALADYCGGALERLKNETERKRIERRNLVLSKLAHSLSTAGTQEEAARVIVESASELFEWDACAIDIYSAETDQAHSLIVIDTINGRRETLQGLPDSPPSEMARRIIRHGGELILRKRENLGPTDTVAFGDKSRPSASLMVVPVRNAERVIGIVSIQSYSFDAYTEEELAALQTLADYCGGALERIRGNEALRESEQRFRSLSESTPVGIFETDAEGRRIYINQRWYEISGMQPGEGLGEDWVRSLHPEDRDRAVAQWRQSLAEGGEWISEHRLQTPQGLTRWVRVIAQPILGKDGKRTAYVGTVEDISDRKRVEQRNAAFSKLGQKLSSASTPEQAARVIGDVAEELFRWDAFSLDLYSSDDDKYDSVLNVDTLNGQKLDVPHTNPTDKPTERARRIMDHGPELVLKDDPAGLLPDTIPFGTPRPSASIMLVPLRDRSRVVGVLSVQSYTRKAYDAEDLRILQLLADYCGGALDRIRAEEALRNSEVRFHSVWENSVDGMRLTDEMGIIVAVNEAYCKLVGMPRSELEGKPFTIAYAASENLNDFMRKYKIRFQRRTIPKLIKRQITFSSGNEVDLENANSFIESRDGKTLVLGLFRDVTAQKRLEEELRQSQKLESIGRLAGGVAHDFNNILTVINGHAEMLLLDRDNLTIDVADSIEQIGKAAERAAGLTRQLLAFGRKQIMQPRNIDLNEVVSNMTKMLQRMLGEDIALQVSFHSNLPVIYADPTMIEQILLNLAVNSRDAMPKGGELLIHTSTRFIDDSYIQNNPEAYTGQFVSMSVRDTGCGIPLEHLSKIFEPFFTTKDVGKGTGLGLATVYGIIKQHQGWITVSSELSKGTTFEIFLPIGTGRVADDPDAPQKYGMRVGHETILLVEDEPEVRSLASHVLQKLGYQCLEAGTASDAFHIWQKNQDTIDIVLTDIVMPNGMSGRDLAEKLHEQKPGLKILFTSGYPKDVVGKDFILREGVNFLQKPYTTQKLAETIRDCLDTGSIIHGDGN